MVLAVINTVLCIVIVLLSYLAYGKNKGLPTLFIGISFGIFGFSHILTIIGLDSALVNILIIARTIAYLLIAIALLLMVKEG